MELPPTAQSFIVHWGEMGTKWGINRSVAQIHALLYLVARPLPADEIAETLAIARSNVSTGLRELQGWSLVRVIQSLGDRRDHFETQGDVWELFRILIRERKRRELEPTLEVLRACKDQVRDAPHSGFPQLESRLTAMSEFMEAANSWGERASRLSPKSLKRLSQLGDAIFKLAE
ncbi:MAG TPA: MarR family transcriptional regulator [Opitutaceae bacterium]|nr:MarR family transcriptional regulator [Opitutaceae bacterium]